MKGERQARFGESGPPTSAWAAAWSLAGCGAQGDRAPLEDLTTGGGSEAPKPGREAGRRLFKMITTSWDDGHPWDMRVAELLAKYGLTGTFYVPITNTLPVMKASDIRKLHALGMEIGSHGVTHSPLVGLPAARRELVESKDRLEQLLSTEVLSFCYPKGRFDRSLLPLVKEAGYRLARTTVSFRVGVNFDPWMMPTSFQFYPHLWRTHVKHAMRGINVRGFAAWLGFFGMECDLNRLSERILGHIVSRGGILHIWGHSWEIDACGLWGELEEVFKRIAMRPGLTYLSNGEIVKQVGACGS